MPFCSVHAIYYVVYINIKSIILINCSNYRMKMLTFLEHIGITIKKNSSHFFRARTVVYALSLANCEHFSSSKTSRPRWRPDLRIGSCLRCHVTVRNDGQSRSYPDQLYPDIRKKGQSNGTTGKANYLIFEKTIRITTVYKTRF